MSHGKHHSLLVVDAFLRFIQVYPVKSIDSIHTIGDRAAQKIVFDAKTSFMSFDSSTFFPKLGIPHVLRTKWSPWTNGKVEVKNELLSS